MFDRAYTVTPLTLPAHASMLTGLYPLRHGVRENGLWSLSEEAQTLAESAREAGFHTGAFLASIVLDQRFGLDQGFDVYEQPERPAVAATTHAAELPGREVVERAIAWLASKRAEDPDRPVFLWIHLFDPHGPWDPSDEHRRRAGGSPYHAEVAVADDAVGMLRSFLAESGLEREATLLVVADHGEGLGDHGEPSHGAFAYESTLRVPLFLRLPGASGPEARERAARTQRLASVVDVHATLLSAMGLSAIAGVDGIDLHGVLDEAIGGTQPESDDRGVYFETYAGYIAHGWSPLAGWVDARGKYVHSSSPQFFDIANDPREQRDLVEERTDVTRYRDAIASLAELPVLSAGDADVLDPALAGELQALGYAAVGVPREPLPHPLAPSDRPSPPSRMQSYRETLLAMELANQGRLGEAAERLATLASEHPDDFFVLDRLGDAWKRLGRHEEAIEPLRRVADDGPAWPYSLFTLGICLLETERHDEALAIFRRALANDPGLVQTTRAMLDTLAARGDGDLAQRYATLLEN